MSLSIQPSGQPPTSPERKSPTPPTPVSQLLLCNSSTRMRSRDMFMLMALWMEKFPMDPPPLFRGRPGEARPTGCLLVDSKERIVGLDHTGESHAIVRAILSCSMDPRGFDVYVSRFPCALCTKMMVQAGIRKIYYFPASEGEIDWESASSPVRDPNQSFGDELRSPLTTGSSTVSRKEKQEKNKRSVHRLIQNNSIAMALYIPQWLHSDWKLSLEGEAELAAKYTIPDDWGWHLDNSIGSSPSISDRWPSIQAKFNKTLLAMHILETRYKTHICRLKCGEEVGTEPSKDLHRHAIILAHIAARRTDDPKVGVGAVLINHEGQYMSVGWNGYPKKTQHLDYPHAGADDCVEDEELKYDYILHAEQNALLWRNPTGVKLNPDTVLVSTKMPCDECSPVMSDCGVRSVVTVPQAPKASDDPARLRGLTYEKLSKLVTDIAIFQL